MTVVNRDVRAAAGVDGGIVITSAWCSTCKQDAMPTTSGECGFCGQVIVDEDRLSAREMLARLGEPPPARPPAPQPKSRFGPPRKWTRGMIVAAIQRWHAEHGKPPTQAAWSRRGDWWPSWSTAAQAYHKTGGWGMAIEAAGFDRPTYKTKYPKSSGRARVVGEPAVTSSATNGVSAPLAGEEATEIPSAVVSLLVRPAAAAPEAEQEASVRGGAASPALNLEELRAIAVDLVERLFDAIEAMP